MQTPLAPHRASANFWKPAPHRMMSHEWCTVCTSGPASPLEALIISPLHRLSHPWTCVILLSFQCLAQGRLWLTTCFQRIGHWLAKNCHCMAQRTTGLTFYSQQTDRWSAKSFLVYVSRTSVIYNLFPTNRSLIDRITLSMAQGQAWLMVWSQQRRCWSAK